MHPEVPTVIRSVDAPTPPQLVSEAFEGRFCQKKVSLPKILFTMFVCTRYVYPDMKMKMEIVLDVHMLASPYTLGDYTAPLSRAPVSGVAARYRLPVWTPTLVRQRIEWRIMARAAPIDNVVLYDSTPLPAAVPQRSPKSPESPERPSRRYENILNLISYQVPWCNPNPPIPSASIPLCSTP